MRSIFSELLTSLSRNKSMTISLVVTGDSRTVKTWGSMAIVTPRAAA